MSHFFVVAILPKNAAPDGYEPIIEKLMAQYEEDREVPEYERECYCVGGDAHARARKAADEEVGEFVRPPVLAAAIASLKFGAFDLEGADKRLDDDLFAAYQDRLVEARSRILAADPEATKPDGDCQECGGTGKEKTTRNPLAKWDWYVIGGRWDGAIQSDRKSDGKGNYGNEHHQLDRNVRRAGDLPSDGDGWAPFAIVTPDGSWHERAKMGWFGSTHGSRTHADWDNEARGICAQYADHMAVGLDCHI